VSPDELEPGARVIRASDAADPRDGSANVVRLRPGGMVELLLDREIAAESDRLCVLPACDVRRVTTDLSHISASYRQCSDTVRNHRAWYDLPYSAVPWNTNRAVVHKVVAIHGTMFTGWQSGGTRVVGVTACGKGRSGNLELDRDDTGTFPLCARCWPKGSRP
jgi:hypothetical protein